MSHWARQYIGRPYQLGATGPEAFDCYGFVAHVEREQFGRTVLPPHIAIDRIVRADLAARQAIAKAIDGDRAGGAREARAQLSVLRRELASARSHARFLGWRVKRRGEAPEDGDIVEAGYSSAVHHVGVWAAADGGGLVHCVDPVGVLFQSRGALARSGWGKLTFYGYEPHESGQCARAA